MKRLGSSDSLAALMSICPTEELSPRSTHVYSREFQSMLDGLEEEGCIEESGHITGKKRRLSVEQVKALEKNFEVENKLEPERKVKLAQELGLQPRQVAVWFQNRRARWKTKQLERDYGVLKASYDDLKLNCVSLQRDNDALVKEIKELKAKLNEENREMNPLIIKEEAVISDTENKDIIETPVATPIDTASDSKELDYDASDDGAGILIFQDLKDGSSDDSDSSAILNEDHSPKNHHLVMSPTSSSFRFNCSAHSSLNCNRFSDPSNAQKAYQPQLVKLEEHNFFSGEEACNFFSDEQAPSLHWYCPGPDSDHDPDQWN